MYNNTSQFNDNQFNAIDFNIITNSHTANAISQSELSSFLITTGTFNISGVATGIYTPLNLVFTNFSASGIGTAVHDSEIFYVWEGEHKASGVAIAELDGVILGRLLFRGKQMSK